MNMIDQRVRKLTPDFMTYTIAKMGLWAFTQTGAQALAPRVRVNAIGPGPDPAGHRQSDAISPGSGHRQSCSVGANPRGYHRRPGLFLDAPARDGQLLCVDGGPASGWRPRMFGVAE